MLQNCCRMRLKCHSKYVLHQKLGIFQKRALLMKSFTSLVYNAFLIKILQGGKYPSANQAFCFDKRAFEGFISGICATTNLYYYIITCSIYYTRKKLFITAKSAVITEAVFTNTS